MSSTVAVYSFQFCFRSFAPFGFLLFLILHFSFFTLQFYHVARTVQTECNQVYLNCRGAARSRIVVITMQRYEKKVPVTKIVRASECFSEFSELFSELVRVELTMHVIRFSYTVSQVPSSGAN